MIKMELIIARVWKNSEAVYQISVDGFFTKQQLKKMIWSLTDVVDMDD